MFLGIDLNSAYSLNGLALILLVISATTWLISFLPFPKCGKKWLNIGAALFAYLGVLLQAWAFQISPFVLSVAS